MKKFHIIMTVFILLGVLLKCCGAYPLDIKEKEKPLEQQPTIIEQPITSNFDTATYNSSGEMYYTHSTYTYKYVGGTTLIEQRWEQENNPAYYMEFAIDGTGIMGDNGKEYVIAWEELSSNTICIYIPTLKANPDGTYIGISNQLHYVESEGYLVSEPYWSAKCEESVFIRIKLMEVDETAYVRTIGLDTGTEHYFYKYDFYVIPETGDVALATKPKE